MYAYLLSKTQAKFIVASLYSLYGINLAQTLTIRWVKAALWAEWCHILWRRWSGHLRCVKTALFRAGATPSRPLHLIGGSWWLSSTRSRLLEPRLIAAIHVIWKVAAWFIDHLQNVSGQHIVSYRSLSRTRSESTHFFFFLKELRMHLSILQKYHFSVFFSRNWRENCYFLQN